MDRTATDWPMFRQNPQRTGYIPDSGPVEAPQRSWTYEILFPSYSTYEDTIYALDQDTGHVHAIGFAGQRRWTHNLGNSHESGETELAIDPQSERLIVVGEGSEIHHLPIHGGPRPAPTIPEETIRYVLDGSHKSGCLIPVNNTLFILQQSSLLEIDLSTGADTLYDFTVGASAEAVMVDGPLAYQDESFAIIWQKCVTRFDLSSGEVL
jgi:hypothetical protein